MKVKLTIECDHKDVEMVNFLLNKAYHIAVSNKTFQEHYSINKQDLNRARKFAKILLSEFLKTQNK